ncbi:MAG TPA: Sec-independent protein translocase protein TatB [Steroidobacteraceae bacterium]|nr:Sec-independent protein translocase protein TatB [Steroidobacteraceae bacterium]
MFDIGFSEVLVIFVLALVVLGPEKLPRVASQMGRWLGRARAMARQFREQLEEEIHLEEARRTPIAKTPEPVSPSAAVGGSPATVPNPAAATIPAMTPSSPVAPSAQAEAAIVYPDTYSHAHPTDREGRPITAAEAAILYRAASPSADAGHATTTQTHASPTDQTHASPAASPAAETPSSDSAAAHDEDPLQQDWVGGVSAAQKAPQGAADAAYAPANERGTRKTG